MIPFLISAILPIFTAVGFNLIKNKPGFIALGYKKQQLLIGIVFGLVCIFASEFGYPIDGVQMNVRDAAPLVASFIFGAPAGIIAAVIPLSEVNLNGAITNRITYFSAVVLFELIFLFISWIITSEVVKPLSTVTESLEKIAHGKLDEKIDADTSREFVLLSNSINITVDALNNYIQAAKDRYKEDLMIAKTIQASALPASDSMNIININYDLYALMEPAKDVGGDFYDFYTVNDKLYFLVADVSGKGIPAAMFMMRSKAIIKTYLEDGLPIDEALYRCNNELCVGNDACMFLTAWIGCLEPKTGVVHFISAGHNAPIVKRADGTTFFIKQKSNFILAAMEDFTYQVEELQLYTGDHIILYTDGVTEALNVAEEQYSDKRFLSFVQDSEFNDCSDVCQKIRADVSAFAGNAEQFDDITILALQLQL